MEHVVWEHRPQRLRHPVMVAAFSGWNDAASAASGAVSFLGAQLGAERFARIDPEPFYDFQATRPMIDLTVPGEQTLTWPEVELYEARTLAGPDLVLVLGSEPSMRWRTFCGALLEVGSRVGVEVVLTLGSLLADVAHTRPIRLTGMASDDELVRGLHSRPPSYHGPTGITGVLHHAAGSAGVRAVSLWAPVPHYAAGVPNPKGSLALVRGVGQVTGIGMETSELERAVVEHEAQVSRAVSGDERLRALVARLEDAEDAAPPEAPGPLPSGDELAAELERFLRQREDPGA